MIFKGHETYIKLDASVYHVNTQEGSPTHFSNESYTVIIIFADYQFVHVITVEPLLSGHHYCKPKVAVQDKWPLIGGHVLAYIWI